MAEPLHSPKETLVVVTDAWHPQINGVVVVLENLSSELRKLGVWVEVIHPALFPQASLPKYKEVKLAIAPWRIRKMLEDMNPDFVHVATEGPLGLAARRWLSRKRVPFTSAVHTKFPEYFNLYLGTPVTWGYRYLRWFHAAATTTLVQSTGQMHELAAHGLQNLHVVGGGVDINRFKPGPRTASNLPKLLFVGRVSREKNIEDFIELEVPSEKTVVGDGPHLNQLRREYPNVRFVGYKQGDELVQTYVEADCLVFPSRTDTFGLVMAEAMACGTPVAAYPVTGPEDIVEQGISGYLHEDLKFAVSKCLDLDRSNCRNTAIKFSWAVKAREFLRVNQEAITAAGSC